MSKPTSTQQIVTANDLLTGSSLFFHTDGTWQRNLDTIHPVNKGKEADTVLTIAKRYEDANQVVGCYLIDVIEENDTVTPVRFRERLRLSGPSILANGLSSEPAIAIRA